MKTITYIIILTLLFLANHDIPARDLFPVQEGRLVFHSYSDYAAWDGRLYMLDLAGKTTVEISKNWNIDHAINAHFSPDGSQLTFMGDDRGEPRDWDVYLWSVDSDEQPVNLTHGYNTRDEDPKFSPDGRKIVFKQTYWDNRSKSFKYDLKELDLSGNIIQTITPDNSDEESMPYYTMDGSRVLYSKGAGATADIYMIDLDGTGDRALCASYNIQEYYPIARDDSSFLFTRWFSAGNAHDQIYLGNFSGKAPVRLPFNEANAENADPYPVGPDYVIFSSTRGSSNDYDLYLGNIHDGQVWSLSGFGINSVYQQLGSCYCPASNAVVKRVFTSQQSMVTVLRQNRPNPFNSCTTISYSLGTSSRVNLKIYDTVGRRRAVLLDEFQAAGDYFITWEPHDCPSGLYFIELITDKNRCISKCALVK
jgi:Tol biopolymer transport system component